MYPLPEEREDPFQREREEQKIQDRKQEKRKLAQLIYEARTGEGLLSITDIAEVLNRTLTTEEIESLKKQL